MNSLLAVPEYFREVQSCCLAEATTAGDYPCIWDRSVPVLSRSSDAFLEWRKRMSKRHILVVDDEQNMLLAMQFILEVADYKVTTAEDGQEALDKILDAKDSGNPVELLITDIQMPFLTGLEMIDELNLLEMDIPVLVITGYGNNELIAQLRCKGCNEHLDKPFDDEELVSRVAMLLEKKESP